MPAYKMITLSEKEVGRIAGNAGAHADTIAQDLTARWRETLPKSQKVINIHQLQLCVRDDLRRLRAEITVATRITAPNPRKRKMGQTVALLTFLTRSPSRNSSTDLVRSSRSNARPCASARFCRLLSLSKHSLRNKETLLCHKH